LEYRCAVDTPSSAIANPAGDARQAMYVHVMYALHGVSIIVGLVTTVLGQRTLFFGIPSLVAVGIGLALRGRVRGSWLATHLNWQLLTFGVVVALLGAATLAFGNIAIILTRVPLLEISCILIGVWAGIRAFRGWDALREGRAVAAAGIF
jgi:uncharacterized membrane protein